MNKNLQKALKDKQKEADRVKRIIQQKKEKAAQKAAADAELAKDKSPVKTKEE